MKNKILKFLSVIVFVCLISFTSMENVNAASASIKVTSSTSSPVVGGTFYVYVTISSSSPIGSWEYTINYDSSDVTLNSGTSHIVENADSGSKYSVTYTYTFTAKSSGTTSISVKNYLVVCWDESVMTTSLSSKSLSIITQEQLEASYSKDNNLDSIDLSLGEFTEEFDPDITEYTVNLEPLTESIDISASVSDSKSSLSGEGTYELSEGTNKIELTVTAQNGSIKTYTINAIVAELEPITVTLNNEELTVVRNYEYLTRPLTYTEEYIYMGENEIPAFVSEITGFTLVGLKDLNGDISLYIYDDESEIYTLYEELLFSGVTLYLLDFPIDLEIPEGYEEYEITIADTKIQTYKLSESSNYSLVYGLNVETNKENLYVYDKSEGTLQIYNDEEIIVLHEEVDAYKLCAFIFAGLNIVLILALCYSLKKSSKKKTKENKKVEKKDYESLNSTDKKTLDSLKINNEEKNKENTSKKTKKKPKKDEEDF